MEPRLRQSFFALLVPILIQCTGSLPSAGSLPRINGSEVTNVSATSVGDVSATAISSAVKTVGAASADSTAGTLVNRDASGNFSAGTITAALNGNASSASFAIGQKGTTILAAATLAVPDNGNHFDVSGSTPISGMSTKPAGARVTLYFNDGARLDASKNFVLQGGPTSQFTTAAGDLFEFLSTGPGWIELSRTTTNESEVVAHIAAATNVGITPAPLSFDTSDYDHQNEYSASGGYFLPKQRGLYQFAAGFITLGFSAAGSCTVLISNLTSGEGTACHCIVMAAGFGCPMQCSATLRMATGEKAAVSAVCTPGASLNVTSANYSKLRVHRLGN